MSAASMSPPAWTDDSQVVFAYNHSEYGNVQIRSNGLVTRIDNKPDVILGSDDDNNHLQGTMISIETLPTLSKVFSAVFSGLQGDITEADPIVWYRKNGSTGTKLITDESISHSVRLIADHARRCRYGCGESNLNSLWRSLPGTGAVEMAESREQVQSDSVLAAEHNWKKGKLQQEKTRVE